MGLLNVEIRVASLTTQTPQDFGISDLEASGKAYDSIYEQAIWQLRANDVRIPLPPVILSGGTASPNHDLLHAIVKQLDASSYHSVLTYDNFKEAYKKEYGTDMDPHALSVMGALVISSEYLRLDNLSPLLAEGESRYAHLSQNELIEESLNGNISFLDARREMIRREDEMIRRED